jgi:hypothetical protein
VLLVLYNTIFMDDNHNPNADDHSSSTNGTSRRGFLTQIAVAGAGLTASHRQINPTYETAYQSYL